MTPPDTGYPDADAESDFERAWRRRALSRIAARLRSEPDDVSAMLPFEEVVAALGRVGETDLGVELISLDSIVGTVDRRERTFDRSFRPASAEVRGRWQSIAAARRRGVAMPPIDVYRVGEMHFVRDGHHRVSVARAMGESTIEARVREVRTAVGGGRRLQMSDLPLKRHERMFQERVPLPPEARRQIQLSDEWRYARLATFIEAWGFRASHARGHLLSRQEMAEAWFNEEYRPIVGVLREAGVGGEGTEAERYLRFAELRYLLLNTLEWTDEVVERLFGEVRPPTAKDDTGVHQILKEMT
jgi:hypothetical protein